MELFVLELAQKYPIALSVLSALYILGAINKPLFTLLHKYAEATDTKSDNEFLAKIESSKAYKAVSYFLDWAVRIKLPQPKPDDKP